MSKAEAKRRLKALVAAEELDTAALANTIEEARLAGVAPLLLRAAGSRLREHVASNYGRSSEPCRFQVGDRVEVKISCDSELGNIEMISIENCDGGRWVLAKVWQLRYRQDDWCAEYVCAYTVTVQGDRDPGGMGVATPVREDDERCIRAAPPPAPRPPPRFAVGTRVECNGGSRGWKGGWSVRSGASSSTALSHRTSWSSTTGGVR